MCKLKIGSHPYIFQTQDVSHLSVRDLMLLDTKVVTLRGLRVAVCSIFGTVREMISMAGSPIEVAKIAKVLAKDRGVRPLGLGCDRWDLVFLWEK